jgi:cytochrome c-type biogenesis protein CcmH
VDPILLATLAAVAGLALVAIAPLALSLRRPAPMRGRRDSALALHRAQLAELDRELAAGRIAAAEHATARLEVQRRLLAAAAETEAMPTTSSRVPLIATLVLVPSVAFGLYLYGGHPDMPGAPLAERRAAAAVQARQEDGLIARLRERLVALDPKSDMARQGYVLLGNAEAGRARYAEAAAAWRHALAVKYDATLAAETAEAQTRADGKLTPATIAMFRRALAEAPADAPWRKLAEERIKGAP